MVRGNRPLVSDHFPSVVQLSTEKICYLCGRTPAQFYALFNAESIKAIAPPVLEKQRQEILSLIETYLTYLKTLYQETCAYPPELTRREFETKPSIVEKIAPRFRELKDILIDTRRIHRHGERDFSTYTIEDHRRHLASIIESIEQFDYTPLQIINLELYELTQQLREGLLDTFKNDKTEFICQQKTKYYDFNGRDVHVQFSDPRYYDLECYYLDEYEAYEKYLHSDKKNQGRPIPRPTPLELNKVIGIDLQYYLCPICSDLFSKIHTKIEKMESQNADYLI